MARWCCGVVRLNLLVSIAWLLDNMLSESFSHSDIHHLEFKDTSFWINSTFDTLSTFSQSFHDTSSCCNWKVKHGFNPQRHIHLRIKHILTGWNCSSKLHPVSLQFFFSSFFHIHEWTRYSSDSDFFMSLNDSSLKSFAPSEVFSLFEWKCCFHVFNQPSAVSKMPLREDLKCVFVHVTM